MNSYQVKKIFEQLKVIKSYFLTVTSEDKKILDCIDRAYSSLSKAITALDDLQDLLLREAQKNREQ